MYGIYDNRQTVTTAGTRVAVSSSSLAVAMAIITAETDNTGIMVVGGSTVVAALATRRGAPLDAGDSVTLYNVKLNEVYLDSTVDGDGVTYLYVG